MLAGFASTYVKVVNHKGLLRWKPHDPRVVMGTNKLLSAGPIARSPEDLELLTRVLTGEVGPIRSAVDLTEGRTSAVSVKGLAM